MNAALPRRRAVRLGLAALLAPAASLGLIDAEARQRKKRRGNRKDPRTVACDPSYPDICVPPPPPDFDCGDLRVDNFRVVGRDPHGFDGDDDGIGCEG